MMRTMSWRRGRGSGNGRKNYAGCGLRATGYDLRPLAFWTGQRNVSSTVEAVARAATHASTAAMAAIPDLAYAAPLRPRYYFFFFLSSLSIRHNITSMTYYS